MDDRFQSKPVWIGQYPSPFAQVSSFPALFLALGAGAGASCSRLCCVLSLGTARGHLSSPGVRPAPGRDRARAPQTHPGHKAGCGGVGVLPQPLSLLPSPPSHSLLWWTGHLFNSFCKPGWNKELSPDFPIPVFPSLSQCCLHKLCAWGILDSFTFGKGLWITSGNTSLRPGMFCSTWAFQAQSSQAVPSPGTQRGASGLCSRGVE